MQEVRLLSEKQEVLAGVMVDMIRIQSKATGREEVERSFERTV